MFDGERINVKSLRWMGIMNKYLISLMQAGYSGGETSQRISISAEKKRS
jgi:hypothetical protein